MYKNGQGMASRIGVAVIGFILAFFAGYHWFTWRLGASIADVSADTVSLSDYLLGLPFIGAVILFAGIAGFFIHLSFYKPVSGDYLIDMDLELRKVVWPAVQPLFSPKAEAWGSTYVVIVCTIILTVFLWVVDLGLNTFTTGLYSVLF